MNTVFYKRAKDDLKKRWALILEEAYVEDRHAVFVVMLSSKKKESEETVFSDAKKWFYDTALFELGFFHQNRLQKEVRGLVRTWRDRQILSDEDSLGIFLLFGRSRVVYLVGDVRLLEWKHVSVICNKCYVNYMKEAEIREIIQYQKVKEEAYLQRRLKMIGRENSRRGEEEEQMAVCILD